MIRLIARYVATILVVLSILAPTGGGALAAFGLADDRVLVICTGDGLRTIRVGADGAPLEVSDSAETCALVHTAGTAQAFAPSTPAPVLLAALEPAQAQSLATPQGRQLSSFPRAPPAV